MSAKRRSDTGRDGQVPAENQSGAEEDAEEGEDEGDTMQWVPSAKALFAEQMAEQDKEKAEADAAARAASTQDAAGGVMPSGLDPQQERPRFAGWIDPAGRFDPAGEVDPAELDTEVQSPFDWSDEGVGDSDDDEGDLSGSRLVSEEPEDETTARVRPEPAGAMLPGAYETTAAAKVRRAFSGGGVAADTLVVDPSVPAMLDHECRICGKKVTEPVPRRWRGSVTSKSGFRCDRCGNVFCAAHVVRVNNWLVALLRGGRFRCLLCQPGVVAGTTAGS